MIELKNREKKFIIIGIIIIAVSLAYARVFYPLYINIRVSGKFEDIIGFLKDWESYHRIINITETRMYPDEDNNIVGEFVANIYILKTEEGFVEDLDNHIFNGEKGRSDPFAPI